MPRLDPRPARTDLTDREAAKIVSSLLGGLCQMCDVSTIRRAIVAIAEAEQFWRMMEIVRQLGTVTVDMLPGAEDESPADPETH